MTTAQDWSDYELIDTGNGEKLERWGSIKMIRPDPQIIWPPSGDKSLWHDVAMRYHRSRSGGGQWEMLKKTPSRWTVSYGALRFHVKPTDFKHMGLFPEQAVNWRWAAEKISQATSQRPVRVLNLFGYTGGATVACLQAGAEVTHVDAAKGMNQWARENIELSGLSGQKHRVLTDDALKFVRREARRNSLYDAVIMDPPAFGRGPSGELWKLEERLYELAGACAEILSDKPLFMLLNAYTAGFSPVVAENLFKIVFAKHQRPGRVTCGEIGLTQTYNGLILPCGLFARWEAEFN